ncbi:MAG: DotD/TraH family lipoprotein [Myxococcales bacterium]|nr:DotD/TraH family lipoprotein [Myxococcales bacterium]
MRVTPILLSLAVLTAVSGCASPSGRGMDSPPIDEVDAKIAEAVEISANANKAIAEVEVATAAPVRAGPAQHVPDNVVLPPEAVQPITVDWNGPVETFLQAIAQRSGYTLSVTGRAPANQIMISLRAEEEPLFGVVRRAGNMVNGYADIALNPSNKTIDLRYGG